MIKRLSLLLISLVTIISANALTYSGLYQDFQNGTSEEATITFDFSWIEVEPVAQPWSFNVYVYNAKDQKIVNLWFNSGSHFQYQHHRGANSQNVYMFVPSGPDVTEYMMVETTITPADKSGDEDMALLEVHFINTQGIEVARFSRAWSHSLAQQLYQELNEAIGMLNMQSYSPSPSPK